MPDINTIVSEAKAFLSSPIKSLAAANNILEAFVNHHEPQDSEEANITMIPAKDLPKETLEEIAEHFGVETSEVESVGVSESSDQMYVATTSTETRENLSSSDISGEPVAASSGASDEAPHHEVNDQAVS